MPRGRTKAKQRQLTIGQIEKMLYKCNGVITRTAENLGVTRSAISMRVSKSPKLKAAIKKIQKIRIDKAENVVFDCIDEGNLTAAFFVLKTIGKHRGYSERQEISGQIDHNIRIEKIERVIIDPEPFEQLPYKSAEPVLIAADDD